MEDYQLQVGDVFQLSNEQRVYLGNHRENAGVGGDYVTISTAMTGGGTGHGPGDVYPDGWEVHAKKLKDSEWDPEGQEISFYQSGSFTCVIPNLEPIRKMKMRFE